MALKLPLVLTNGQIEQLQTGDTVSLPASDITLTAGATGPSIRDVMYVSAAGIVSKAQANAQATSQAFGFAIAAAAGGAACTVRTDGTLTGFTALTAGSPVFLDITTAGAITQTAPSTVGQFVTRLGIAINTTDIEIEIQAPIKL